MEFFKSKLEYVLCHSLVSVDSCIRKLSSFVTCFHTSSLLGLGLNTNTGFSSVTSYRPGLVIRIIIKWWQIYSSIINAVICYRADKFNLKKCDHKCYQYSSSVKHVPTLEDHTSKRPQLSSIFLMYKLIKSTLPGLQISPATYTIYQTIQCHSTSQRWQQNHFK